MVTDAMPASPKDGPTPGVSNVSYAVKLAMRFFLETKHYRQLLRILSHQWQSCHSLTAAIRLMEAHGVKMTPQEEEALIELPEDRMIQALVNRMTGQSREKFEHFFLQLSFVASTTTRLRTALEMGSPDAIEEALESAENVGVLGYLLKMTISQAGEEVTKREKDHEDWLGDMNGKMAPLLSTSVAAMAVQKELAQAKATIETYYGDAKNKSRGVLMSMSESNLQALVQNVFIAWNAHVRKVRIEAEIKAEYQDEIDAINKKLFAMREAQLANVKKVLQKQSGAAMDAVMVRCLDALKKEQAHQLKRIETAKQGEELMQKISDFSSTSAANAQKVMSRMNAGNDTGLRTLAFQGWMQYMKEFKEDAELSKTLREKEAQVNAFKEKQSKNALNVVTSMTNSNNAAMMSNVYMAWIEIIKERKEKEVVEQELNAKAFKHSSITSRNKAAGMKASDKVAFFQDQQLVIFAMCHWKKDARVGRIRRTKKDEKSAQKKELGAVKGMWKNFATEIETSLQQPTPRIEMKPRRQEAIQGGQSSDAPA